MRAGTLRHPVTIEQEGSTASATLGEVNPTAWPTFASWRCQITSLSGAELQTAQVRYPTVSHRLTGRYRPGVKPQMRINKGGRLFRIDAVLNMDERNRELQILATEIVT